MSARTPVVMIHGAFCGSWAFEGWGALYQSRGFEVHTPTLRHHEESNSSHSELGQTSICDYADDLTVLLDRIGVPPILIGHSLGGLLSQILATRRLVRALVLLAPSAPWGLLPSTASEFVAAQALYLEGPFWRRPIAPRHWIAAANALDLVPREQQDGILARLVPESGRAMFEVMQWMFDFRRATYVDPRAVVCPILCLAGSRDRINSPSTVRRISRRYGGRARYEELPGHSHWLTGEPGWERIAAGSLNWLDHVGGRGAARVGREP